MSEPKRYKLRPIFWDYIQVKSVSKDQIDAMGNESAYFHKDGDWVKWEDYARLKAEVERLTEAWVDKKMQEDRDALLKQVERLTKAGDAMAGYFDKETQTPDGHNFVFAWNDAKEGKQ